MCARPTSCSTRRTGPRWSGPSRAARRSASWPPTRAASTRCCARGERGHALGAARAGRAFAAPARSTTGSALAHLGRPADHDGRRRDGAVAVLGALHADEVADLERGPRSTSVPPFGPGLVLKVVPERETTVTERPGVRLHRDVVAAQRGDLPRDRGPGHAHPAGARALACRCSPTPWWRRRHGAGGDAEAEDGGQGAARGQACRGRDQRQREPRRGRGARSPPSSGGCCAVVPVMSSALLLCRATRRSAVPAACATGVWPALRGR